MQDPNKLLAKIVRRLRTIGMDTQLVEVKEAAWKLPERYQVLAGKRVQWFQSA